MTLWPFFTFFGGKWRTAPRYPSPKFPAIVESFAGSAGYSTRYADRKVTLCERDPQIAGLWRYLIRVRESEIRGLPLLGPGQSTSDLHGIAEEARWLIGFWLNKGMTAPCKQPSAWARSGIRPNSFWGSTIRDRIASQVGCIRHWQVLDNYTLAPDSEATWFIDPPYQGDAGRRYRFHDLDYGVLGSWCRQRIGQATVCENAGALWLPFSPFITAKSTPGAKRAGVSHEVVWFNENQGDSNE